MKEVIQTTRVNIGILEKKQDVLVDALKLYYERVGKIYESPTDATPKWSPNSDAR